MSMEDFMNDLNGGFQGAGTVAPLAAQTGNPWAAAGVLAVGAGMGVMNSRDPNKKRALRLNNRLGDQEVAANELNLADLKGEVTAKAQKRKSWDQFGSMFSRYMSGYALARPSGQAAFNQDLGVL